jgi:hypothetical protein
MSAWGTTKSRVASSSSTHHPKFIPPFITIIHHPKFTPRRQKGRAHKSAQIGVMSAWGPNKSRVASSSSTHHPKFIPPLLHHHYSTIIIYHPKFTPSATSLGAFLT